MVNELFKCFDYAHIVFINYIKFKDKYTDQGISDHRIISKIIIMKTTEKPILKTREKTYQNTKIKM